MQMAGPGAMPVHVAVTVLLLLVTMMDCGGPIMLPSRVSVSVSMSDRLVLKEVFAVTVVSERVHVRLLITLAGSGAGLPGLVSRSRDARQD